MTFDLFDDDTTQINVLPYDGEVNNYGIVLSQDKADMYYERLLHNAPWQADNLIIHGKAMQTARHMALFGKHSYRYVYSGVPHESLPWRADLLDELHQLAEQYANASFNSCLANLYHNGNEGMAWHSDNEPIYEKETVIASLSFGASRKFVFKHKQSAEKREIMLHHGQLVVMRGVTQQHWLHAIMKTTTVHTPRINLTFRCVKENAFI